MERILVILLFPLYSFSQNFEPEIELLQNLFLRNYLSQSINDGYIIQESSEGNVINYPNSLDPFIVIKKTKTNRSVDGFGHYSVGNITKVIHVMQAEDNLSEAMVWKVDVIYLIAEYSNTSNNFIRKKHEKILKNIEKQISYRRFKKVNSTISQNITDVYGYKYNYVEKNKYSLNEDIIYLSKANILANNNKSNWHRDIYVFENKHSDFQNTLFELNNTISKQEKSTIKKLKTSVQGFSYEEINVYDLDKMIDIFLKDCKSNGISINPEMKINATFDSMNDEILALAYGLDNDEEIIIKVNPINWKQASTQKKWYIMYHELGHDVLNLLHGQGGKMMYPFVDRDYTWEEFYDDKKYMFEYVKNNN